MKLKRLLAVITSICVMMVAFQTSATAGIAENERYIYYYLINEMGFNNAAAAGVLANIDAESDFRPNLQEYGYTWEEGCGYGICQWTNSPRTSATGRRTNVVKWCESLGLDKSSLDGQLSYLKYELQNKYKKVWNTLKSVTNDAQGAYDAGYTWCYYFEVPQGYNTGGSEKRGNIAKDTYWPKYSDGPKDSPTGEYKITATSLNVRSDAASYFSVLTSVPKDTVVKVTKSLFNWGKITYNGKTGWICLDYASCITPDPTTTTVTTAKRLGKYQVTNVDTNLNVRSGAGSTYDVVAKIYNNDVVEVSEISGNWAKITKDDINGWVSMDYLTLVTPATTATTATTTANVTTTTAKADVATTTKADATTKPSVATTEKATTTVAAATTATSSQPTTSAEIKAGDCNGDTYVNSFDIMLMKRAIVNVQYKPDIMDRADMNKDGELNSFDIMLVKKLILELYL